MCSVRPVRNETLAKLAQRGEDIAQGWDGSLQRYEIKRGEWVASIETPENGSFTGGGRTEQEALSNLLSEIS